MENPSNMQSTQSQPVQEFRGRGALDAFLNLLSLVTLGWTAFSFGGVIFQIINKFFSPQRYVYGFEGYYSIALKFNLASLLIVTPIFLILTGILHKNYKIRKLDHESGIHKWLTYLMLFLAFCNIVGSLIALVFKFLDGIFFSSFILKALTILVIASGIFGYYWYDLRRKQYETKSTVSLISAVLVVVLAVGAVVGGFLLIGSPQRSRMLNFDRQRVSDLSDIRWQVEDYFLRNGTLPGSLSDLPNRPRVNDPKTNQPYEYKIVSSQTFEMCAVFALDTTSSQDQDYDNYYGRDYEWNYHKAGRQCFTTTVQQPVPATAKPIYR